MNLGGAELTAPRFRLPRRILVTRPLAQALPVVAALQALGVQAQALPLMDIGPVPDQAPVRAAWSDLPERRLVMFVSANAVEAFFKAHPPGLAWPHATWAGSTGPGTTSALLAAGVPQALIRQPGPGQSLDSESLWQQLSDRPWAGEQALIVRGEDGRDWLTERLREAGAQVAALAAYRRQTPRWTLEQQTCAQAALDHPHEVLWSFSSSEALSHLRSLMPQADWSASSAVASHARIAQAAREAGFGQVRQIEPGEAALWQAAQA